MGDSFKKNYQKIEYLILFKFSAILNVKQIMFLDTNFCIELTTLIMKSQTKIPIIYELQHYTSLLI